MVAPCRPSNVSVTPEAARVNRSIRASTVRNHMFLGRSTMSDRSRRLAHALDHSRYGSMPRRGDVFNLDLHIAVISDVRAVLESRNLSLTSWSIFRPYMGARPGPRPGRDHQRTHMAGARHTTGEEVPTRVRQLPTRFSRIRGDLPARLRFAYTKVSLLRRLRSAPHGTNGRLPTIPLGGIGSTTVFAVVWKPPRSRSLRITARMPTT